MYPLTSQRNKVMAKDAMNTTTAIDKVICNMISNFPRNESTWVSPRPNWVLLLNPRNT